MGNISEQQSGAFCLTRTIMCVHSRQRQTATVNKGGVGGYTPGGQCGEEWGRCPAKCVTSRQRNAARAPAGSGWHGAVSVPYRIVSTQLLPDVCTRRPVLQLVHHRLLLLLLLLLWQLLLLLLLWMLPVTLACDKVALQVPVHHQHAAAGVVTISLATPNHPHRKQPDPANQNLKHSYPTAREHRPPAHTHTHTTHMLDAIMCSTPPGHSPRPLGWQCASS